MSASEPDAPSDDGNEKHGQAETIANGRGDA
jgi:hypothetical protein